jgi:plasmid stabilization system protein ParE
VNVPVRFAAGVSDDVDGIVEYIAADSVDAALRFGTAVLRTLEGLSEFPRKGSLKDFGNDPRMKDIRSYAIDGFPNHLIFYSRDSDGGVRVLLVSEGHRNIAFVLRRRV